MSNHVIKGRGFLYLLKIAYRNIYRNKRRSVFCISAVGIAVFFIVFMIGWIVGMVESVEKTVLTFESGHIQVFTKDYEVKEDFFPVQYPIEPEGESLADMIDRLRNTPGVKAVMPRISAYATLMDSRVKHAVLWGIDTKNEFKVNSFNLKDRGDGLLEGVYPELDENKCAIGKRLANKMGLKIGDKIPMKIVSSQFSDKFWNPEIVGIFDYDYKGVDENYIISGITKVQKILTLKNKTQKIVIYLDNYKKAEIIQKIITEKLSSYKNLTIKNWREHYFVAMLNQFTFIYVIIFLVFIVVASFLIVNTVLMMIHERIKEIGMMGALGMMKLEIVAVFFLEAILLSIFGSLFGIFIGGVLTKILSIYPIDVLSLSGGIDMPLSNTIFIKFSWFFLVVSFLFGVLVSSVCTIFPSMKSAFIEPVEALRR